MAQDPNAIAQRWAQQLAASGQKIAEGVQSVTMAPGQSAARQKAVWQQNTAAAVDKWAKNTAAVTLSDWQQAMIEKGAPRIAGGAQASIPKFGAFMAELLPHIERTKATLPARGNLDQNINRMTAFVRGMSTFRRTR